MATKYIKSIGVELEGGCSNRLLGLLRTNQDFTGVEIGGDGSVSVPNQENNGVEIKYWSEDFRKVFKMVEFCYINNFRQNKSCGNHLHIKLDDKVVGLLTTEKFFSKFVEWYRGNKYFQTPKFQERLESRWCSPSYSKNDTLEALTHNCKGSYRYKAINSNAYRMYGTIEIRIMPYFNSYSDYRWCMGMMLKKIEELIEELMHGYEVVEKVSLPKRKINKKLSFNQEKVETFIIKRSPLCV